MYVFLPLCHVGFMLQRYRAWFGHIQLQIIAITLIQIAV